MKNAFLYLGCLAAGCARPVPEKTMKLDLETKTTRKKDETTVTASLHNTGTETVTILLEFQLHQTYAKLTDDRGEVIPVTKDSRAAEGRAAHDDGKIKVQVLRPGQSAEVASFYVIPSVQRAAAGPESWELDDVRTKTLTVEIRYVVTEEGAQIARFHKAPDVVVGTWTSKPVTLKYGGATK